MSKDPVLRWYKISADGGESWTYQWLYPEEAAMERKELGHIVVLAEDE